MVNGQLVSDCWVHLLMCKTRMGALVVQISHPIQKDISQCAWPMVGAVSGTREIEFGYTNIETPGLFNVWEKEEEMFEISTILDSKIHGLPITFYLLIKQVSAGAHPVLGSGNATLSQVDIP